MKGKKVRITKVMVGKATATDPRGELVARDSEVSGLALRCYPSGKKVWTLYYRASDGRQRRPVLGDATTLLPDDARKLARELLGDVARGTDPSEERTKRRDAPTVADLVKRYRSEHLPRKKPSSQRDDKRNLDKHVLPALGRRKVAGLTFSDVEALHRSLSGTPYQANRVLALVGKLLALAEDWGWRPQNTNVARRVKKYPERPRHRVLSEIELAQLGKALSNMEVGGANSYATAAIRLLALTGLRRGEVLSLQWRDVDLERGFLTLRDTKTGPRSTPLSGPAVEVLAGLERQPDNAHCFPGRLAGQHLVDLQKPWRKVRKLAGLEGLRIHDLRHGLASVGLGAGLPLAAVGKLLGHRSAATTSRYAEFCDDPARAAADVAAGPIAKALAAGARTARRGES